MRLDLSIILRHGSSHHRLKREWAQEWASEGFQARSLPFWHSIFARLQNLPELQDPVCPAEGGGLMKVKSRSQLQQAATNIFQDLEKNYQPCEIVYIISELLSVNPLMKLPLKQEALIQPLNRLEAEPGKGIPKSRAIYQAGCPLSPYYQPSHVDVNLIDQTKLYQ